MLTSAALTPRVSPAGVVQKPPRQVEEARAQPADGPVQKQLPAAVQRPHAALRRHVSGLHLQQLDQQGPHPGAAVHQELHLLQLHEPAHLPVNVLGAQFHLLHDHGLRHGPLGRTGHAHPGAEQHQQPERDRHVRHQLGHVVVRVSVRAPRLPVQRVPGHLQLQPSDPQTQIQTAPDVRIQRPAEPRLEPERLSIQQLTGTTRIHLYVTSGHGVRAYRGHLRTGGGKEIKDNWISCIIFQKERKKKETWIMRVICVYR